MNYKFKQSIYRVRILVLLGQIWFIGSNLRLKKVQLGTVPNWLFLEARSADYVEDVVDYVGDGGQYD